MLNETRIENIYSDILNVSKLKDPIGRMLSKHKRPNGLNITKGFDTPDVHGTTLLLWALSMFFRVTESGSDNWKV